MEGLNRHSSYISVALSIIYIISALRHLAWLLAVSILKETAGFQIFVEALFLASWVFILVSLLAIFTFIEA